MMMISTKKLAMVSLWASLLLILSGGLQGADIRLSVDQSDLSLGDSFSLIVSLNDEYSGRPPEVTQPLGRSLRVLAGPSVQSSTSIINGMKSAETIWSWQMQATEPGQVTIPPFSLGNLTSNFVTITVKDVPVSNPNNNDDIILLYEANKDQAYVGEQIILTWKIMYKVKLRGNLEPAPLPLSFEHKSLEPQRGKTYVSTQNGQPYEVREFRRAIFATEPGDFQLSPVILRGEYQPNQYQTRSRPITLKSKPLDMSILPVNPIQNIDQDKLPITNQLRVSSAWAIPDQPIDIGEPITLEIHLAAPAQLPSQLPELHVPDHPNVRVYSDGDESRADVNWNQGVTGYRTQKFAIIPQKPGAFTLPPISIYWWNTKSNTLETVEIPEKTIQVKDAGTDQLQSQAIGDEPDINTIDAPDAPKTQESEKSPAPEERHLWQQIALIFLLLWILTMIYGIRRNMARKSSQAQAAQPTKAPAVTKKQDSRRQVQLKIVPILDKHELDLPQKDACREVIKALGNWVGQEKGRTPQNVTQLIECIQPHDPWQPLLKDCETFLYGDGTTWPREKIREALINGLPQLQPDDKPQSKDPLEPFTPVDILTNPKDGDS